MNLLHKLRETCYAVLPVCFIVLALGVTVVPLGATVLVPFCVGSVLLILGLALFLTGADLGIVPAGAFMGAKLTGTRSMPLILATGLLIGVLITVAEPDLLVLAEQVESVTGSVPARHMILAVALGIGFFVAVSLARVLLQIPYRAVLLVGYALAFFLASRSDAVIVAIAFDSGGATTGPMTVPFIIALGIGTSAVRGDKTAVEDGFGHTGIASIGPILAVTALGFFLTSGTGAAPAAGGVSVAAAAATTGAGDAHSFGAIARETLRLFASEGKDVLAALAPLFAIIVAYQAFLMKLPPRLFRRIAFGFIYAWLGLILFFSGADLAFVPAGRALGTALGALDANWILIPVGCALGAIVVCAEPAVWVLTEQVEEASGGNVRKKALLASLAVGVALSVGLSMCRVLCGFSVWYLLAPFYALALALTFATPRLFTAIAFDSGGVASGPIASTFILSLTLGASAAVGGNPATDGFGVIAMIAATPLVAIQILGMLYRARETRAFGRKGR